jgi:hypothetical protein
MTKTQYMNPARKQGKNYVEVNVDFEGVSNSTDTATGLSPIQTSTVNNTSTAYN